MNILLVDDDEVDRAHIRRALNKSNLSVSITEAVTVEQGLQLYKSADFDIVLLDYRMPKRDGIEMVIEIRTEPKNSSTAIVMMSMSEDENIAINCIKAGAQDFLIKTEITESKLRRALVHATTRHELECKLYNTYQKVKSLSETDPLTGLPNRYFFETSLKQAITNNCRTQHKLALLLIDLDNFKLINDNFGHDTGDLFLKQTVIRIKKCLRGNEVFARIGGDEFVIILNNIENNTQASLVANRIINVMQSVQEISSTVISATASIGIALHPDNGNTSAELFKHADIAMYRAKKQGRNQVCFFEHEMQQIFHHRLKIETELKMAIEKKQFELYYQPVINPINDTIQGFEALIRWNVDGVIRMPDQFIEIAEETQQILKIGLWVIEEAISTLAQWHKLTSKPYVMAINLSAIQLGDITLVKYLSACLLKYNVPAQLVEIEITETALFSDTPISHQIINDLNDLGCRLSLDDFGTGYSSISHLQNYPISVVKIDKSLMPTDELRSKNMTLVEGLVAMATILGLDVVAEGIETQKHVDMCVRLNIQRSQGYFYSRPQSRESIEQMFCEKQLTLTSQ